MTDESPSQDTEEAFRLIETTVIPEVTEVRFYDETIPHLAEHKELEHLIPSLETAIDDTISNPTEVYESNPPHVRSFKYKSDRHLHGESSLVVAVKIVEGTSALLKTAYFTSEVTGEVVWRQSDG